MRSLRFLTAAVLLAAMLAALGWSGTVAGQGPPVGDPPEPDAEILQQIAELVLGAQAAGQPVEEELIRELVRQLDPEMSTAITLGGEPGGGIAELPDTKGMPLQATASIGPGTAFLVGVAGIAVGVPALSGMAWYMRRRTVGVR